ncbi:hypothetical protein DNL40_08475 [Xylanimonas oleitrophica]|uniref:Uncharacterized protein n=1 Tax=Xylanimonas oleitrophica TaxID=2607479 RepID=A0A2W5WRJ8_9MICO|nr:hypothetical protein [Xylanimonas oleitrophica]PZR53522.1 hypothetical protein DNL40_08475 [Xylanimonas oleitrophica]
MLMTGAGVALVDGALLGLALGTGRTALAVAAALVGVVAAVVLGWLTPAPQTQTASTVTLGVPVTPTVPPADAEAADAATTGAAAAQAAETGAAGVPLEAPATPAGTAPDAAPGLAPAPVPGVGADADDDEPLTTPAAA